MFSSGISIIVIINVNFIKSYESVNTSETTNLIKLEFIYETTSSSHNIDTDSTEIDEQIGSSKESLIQSFKSSPINKSKLCSTFKTCEECVQSSPWLGCKWCHDYGCTNKAEELCPELEEITRMLPRELKCPRIESKDSTPVPTGVNMNFKLKLYTPEPNIIFKKELICQFKLENQFIHLRAYLLYDTIFCSPITLDFDSNEA